MIKEGMINGIKVAVLDVPQLNAEEVKELRRKTDEEEFQEWLKRKRAWEAQQEAEEKKRKEEGPRYHWESCEHCGDKNREIFKVKTYHNIAYESTERSNHIDTEWLCRGCLASKMENYKDEAN